MSPLVDELLPPLFMPWQLILLRLGGATVLCGLIGYERESASRPAGLRTHMLIGLAAATYSIIMLHLIAQSDAFAGNVRTDPLRIIEALTSGIAFLAAGMIVFSSGKVHGLTTGTGMWLAAAIGLCVGLGLWPVALIVTVLALIVIRALAYVEYKALETKKPEDGEG